MVSHSPLSLKPQLYASAEPLAPMVVDLCGFSRLMADDQTDDKRISRGAAYQLRKIGREAIEAEGGMLVNAFADNLFAVMPTVAAALRAARAISAFLAVSVGIGWGLIVIDGLDIWGDEMNAASELGEDVARRAEILLTEAAKAAL